MNAEVTRLRQEYDYLSLQYALISSRLAEVRDLLEEMDELP